MTILKRILIGLAAVILLLVVGITILVMTLDANLLKPVLVKAAHEQGLELTIDGDLGWQFYPNLGLKLGALKVSSAADKQTLASITSASVSVKLMPLLSQRAIFVNGINLDGLNVQYIVDSNGKSPWDHIGKSKTQTATNTPDQESTPKVEIESLNITHLNLDYRDAKTGDALRVSDTDLTTQNFSMTGLPFNLSLNTTVTYGKYPPTKIEWRGPVTLNLESKTFASDGAKLQLQLANATLKLDLTNKTSWGTVLSSTGAITLQPTNLQALLKALAIKPPVTKSAKALQELSAQFQYAVGDDQAKITDATVQLDQTHLKGDLSVSHFANPKIKTQWHGDAINLDDYLAPPTEGEKAAEAAPAEPLPMETLRSLDLNANLGFDEAQMKGLTIKQPQIQVTADNGLIQLEKLTMNIADGSVVGKGQLDARQAQANLNFELDSANVDIGQILKSTAKIDNIAGNASAKLTASSTGSTDKALMDNLAMDMTAESKRMTLSPFNIEEQFCKAIALAQQAAPPSFDWPKLTEMKPVNMQLNLRDKILKLNQLSADIASLAGSANGEFNMTSGDFNFPVSLSLANFASTVPGCLPIDEKWRKRSLPLRCKGNLKDIGAKTCLPDTKLIGDLIKDKFTAEAKEKLGVKQQEVEKKLGEKTRDAVTKELGEEKAKEIEDKLKNAFDRFKGKKKEKPTEPAPEPANP